MSKNNIEDYKNLLNKFYEFEANENLFDYKISNRYVWDYLRDDIIFNQIKNKYSTISLNKNERSFFTKIYQYFKDLLSIGSYLFHNLFKIKKYDLIIEITDQIRHKYKNFIIHHRTHFYITALKNDYKILIIDNTNNPSNLAKLYKCDVITTRSWHMIDTLRSKLIYINKEDKINLKKLSNKINEKFNLSKNIYRMSIDHLKFQLIQEKRYDKLFNIYQPKIYILPYGGSKKGALKSARYKKIKSIDLQHAIWSKFNPIYFYNNSIQKNTIYPDYYFLWGEYWKTYARLKFPKKIVVGFPFFDINFNKHFTEKKKKNIIIFINDRFTQKKQIELLDKMSLNLKDYLFYFKLRPDQINLKDHILSSKLESRENIKIIQNNNHHIYNYFNISKFVVGAGSTLLFESLFFGNKIISLNSFNSLDLIDFSKINYLKINNSLDETINFITNANNFNPLKKDLYIKNFNHLFVKEVIKNIIDGKYNT